MQLGIVVEDVLTAYQFLVERGLDRDPRDGLTLLRRARPRAFHLRWRGLPRRAQDNFDAAEILRRFLLDLTGEQPQPPKQGLVDGRQREREALYERGPGGDWTTDEIKGALLDAELYPHGVHVIGEGASEWIVVRRLIEALVGQGPLNQIEFFNLRGSGGAAYVEALATAFGDYAIRALVIADREGNMAEYLSEAISRNVIGPDNVMLFDHSLEASNMSRQELIDLARQVGGTLTGDATIDFDLSPAELGQIYSDRVERSSQGGAPGLAEVLLSEINKRTDGALEISKLAFVKAMADHLAAELEEAKGKNLDAIKQHRPIVKFVIERIISALNRPRPAGSIP